MNNEEMVKRLRELADEIGKPTVSKPTPPEWTLAIADDGFARVQFQGVNRTYGTPMSIAVTMVNAGNSFEAMKTVCERVMAENPPVTTWSADSLGEAATKALSLAVYDDDGRLKDE